MCSHKHAPPVHPLASAVNVCPYGICLSRARPTVRAAQSGPQKAQPVRTGGGASGLLRASAYGPRRYDGASALLSVAVEPGLPRAPDVAPAPGRARGIGSAPDADACTQQRGQSDVWHIAV